MGAKFLVAAAATVCAERTGVARCVGFPTMAWPDTIRTMARRRIVIAVVHPTQDIGLIAHGEGDQDVGFVRAISHGLGRSCATPATFPSTMVTIKVGWCLMETRDAKSNLSVGADDTRSAGLDLEDSCIVGDAIATTVEIAASRRGARNVRIRTLVGVVAADPVGVVSAGDAMHAPRGVEEQHDVGLDFLCLGGTRAGAEGGQREQSHDSDTNLRHGLPRWVERYGLTQDGVH